MTKEVAAILKRRLIGLSFFDVIAGIAQAVPETQHRTDGDLKIVKKMPVSYDLVGPKNKYLGLERQLVPNEGKKSIIYFEDFGSVRDAGPGVPARANAWVSSLRLVVWMNKNKFDAAKYADLTAVSIDAILHRLVNNQAINEDGIRRLFVRQTRIPQQDVAIFSRYNYDEAETMYLRPPFEFFAIDFECKYQVAPPACTGHTYNAGTDVVSVTVFIVDAPTNALTTLANGDQIRREYAPGNTLIVLDKNGQPYMKGKKALTTFIVDNGNFQNEPFDTNTGAFDHSLYGGFSSSNAPGVVSFDAGVPLK